MPASSSTSSRLERDVVAEIDYLADAWPALVTLRVPSSGRRRPPGRRDVSEAQRLHAAVLAIQERMEDRQRAVEVNAMPVPPTGPIPAPAVIAVLDLLALFVATAADIAETVARVAGVDAPPQVESSWTDPRPYLKFARTWLTVADGADDRTMPWVAKTLRSLADRVATQLGEVYDGQLLDALCPWCGGRTERRPTGGERTLVVYARQSRRDAEGTKHEGPVIVCRGVNCTPPESACGTSVGAHPAWPEREWDWLSKQLLPTTA